VPVNSHADIRQMTGSKCNNHRLLAYNMNENKISAVMSEVTNHDPLPNKIFMTTSFIEILLATALGIAKSKVKKKYGMTIPLTIEFNLCFKLKGLRLRNK
jgi:hypothetical protein